MDFQENMKKVKVLDEAMEKTGLDKELTEEQKALTKMGTLMGAAPIGIMTGFLNQNQTAEAEKNSPMPEIEEQDPTKRKIIEMLCENTGTHICDSGGAYGRSWQRNRKRNFEEEEAVHLDIWKDEISISYNIYHYLKTFLEVTEESEALQKMFEEFCDRPENKDEYWLTNMEDFRDENNDESVYGSEWGITNTYNYENILSQILQYAVIGYDDKLFIILQVHGGCDARGGYSTPYIFEFQEFDYFLMAQNDVHCYCSKCDGGWHSDDSGYHWYENNDEGDLEWETDEDEKKVFHKGCGGELEFFVMESY